MYFLICRQTAPKVIPPKKICLPRGPRTNKKVYITRGITNSRANNGTKRLNNTIKQTFR